MKKTLKIFLNAMLLMEFNMGNIERPKKGLSVSIFDEAKVENVLVKGAEVVDRTHVSNPKIRKLLKTSIDSSFDKHVLKETLSKWQKVKYHDAMSKALFDLMDTLYSKREMIPNSYQYLIREMAKETPISQLLASYDKLDYQILESFLNNETKISHSFGLMKPVRHGVVEEAQ